MLVVTLSMMVKLAVLIYRDLGCVIQFRGQCVAMKEIRVVHLGWHAFKKEIVIVSRFYYY